MGTKAHEVVRAFLCAQISALLAGDRALHSDDLTDPDEIAGVVHDTRVATRRIRSALKVYGTLFDAERTAHLDAELSWYQDLLGDDRDAAVQRSNLAAAVAALPEDLKLGSAPARIGESLTADETDAHTTLLKAIDSARYRALLAEATDIADLPPLLPDARAADIKDLARKAERRAAKLLRRGLEHDDDGKLHHARRAIKRARYAAELARPLVGEGATKRTLARYQRAQDVLGAYQDAVVAADRLRRLATTSRGNGFTYGVLYEREQQTRRETRRKAAKLTI